MSLPIHQHLIDRAARGEEKAFQILVDRMHYNKKFGGFTFIPAKPDEPIPTIEQYDALEKRLSKALNGDVPCPF